MLVSLLSLIDIVVVTVTNVIVAIVVTSGDANVTAIVVTVIIRDL